MLTFARISALSAIAILCVGATTLPASAGRNNAEPIPPNCTLDPFTGKMNCPITPNCTLDPFTHTMNCHVMRRQAS